jgi:hypothetical protein
MRYLSDDDAWTDLPKPFLCPHCDTPTHLLVEFDEWDSDGVPTDTGTHVSCPNEFDGDAHWDMPYVTLLPLEERAYAWAAENVRIVDSEAKMRARLAAWNAGESIRD